MNTFSNVMPADARKLLDDHLDAVERVLAESGMSRLERRVVCDEVETQAGEMAIARANGEITCHIMQSVISELDPPAGYRQPAEPAPSHPALSPPPQKLSSFAIGSVIVPIIATMLLLSSDGALGVIGWVGGVAVISFLLSMIAIRDIRLSSGRTTGIGFAVFGMLAIPLLVMNFMTYWMSDMLAMEVVGPAISKNLTINTLSKDIDVLKIQFSKEIVPQKGTEGEKNKPGRLDQVPAIHQLVTEREAKLAALKLTSWEKFIIDAEPMITVAIISLCLALSGGISVLIYRMTCRYFQRPMPGARWELAY